MTKRIALLLAMVLALAAVFGGLSLTVTADEPPAPIEIKVHYTRPDRNYDQWHLYERGGLGTTDFEVGENEAVATIYAESNPYYLIFGIECGESYWIDCEWSDEAQTTSDRDLEAAS